MKSSTLERLKATDPHINDTDELINMLIDLHDNLKEDMEF